MAGWSARFDKPIQLARGKRLRTLSDAQDYILKLPRSKQAEERWMAATEAVIMAAEGRGPMMHAYIGMNRAANPQPEGRPRPGAKPTNWGRRKPKRDE